MLRVDEYAQSIDSKNRKLDQDYFDVLREMG